MKKKDYSRAAAGRYKETRRRRRTWNIQEMGGSQLLLQHALVQQLVRFALNSP
jgi:hypothetical protein